MPIRPENRDRYPADWPEISRRIRAERARWQCECRGECGSDHSIRPDESIVWIPDGEALDPSRCYAANGEPHPITGSRVVLTVAHLDHTPEHCDDTNLLAMCQRCHLNLDRPRHIVNARENRRNRLALGDLFGGPTEAELEAAKAPPTTGGVVPFRRPGA